MTLLLCGLFLTAARTSAQDVTSDLLGRINNLRASKGLPGYTLNGSLASAAQLQAQWMIDNDCAIAHTHPDGSNPRSRARASGYGTDEVSENIYCGGMASSDTAWTFWINSGIHYAGLVNNRYKEIGIGSASGAAGTSFVLVFGNPGGPAYIPPAAASGDSGGDSSADSGPPPYVVGSDEHGNIQHQIQEGDTLGQIALIYGYTWADIPAMLAINGMTEADYRDLEIGEIFLVPPKSGTYTPTPGEPPSATPAPFTETPTLEITPEPTTGDDMGILPTPSPTTFAVALAASVPESLVMLIPTGTATVTPESTEVAFLETPVVANLAASGVITPSGTSPWLVIALVVQVGVLILAGFEFIRRMRRR